MFTLSRVFTFGIGSGASTALVKGLAKAGNGTAEFIQEGERLQPKVRRWMVVYIYVYIHVVVRPHQYQGNETGLVGWKLNKINALECTTLTATHACMHDSCACIAYGSLCMLSGVLNYI